MRPLTLDALRPLLQVVTAEELACRSEVQRIVREAAAVRKDIGSLISSRAGAPEADLLAAERWRLWSGRHLQSLQSSLAGILARKAAADAVLARATARREAVERLCETAARNRRKLREARLNDTVLRAELLSGPDGRRHNS